MKGIIFHGDLGKSLLKGTPVLDDIIRRFPISLELGLLSVVIALVIGLPIGTYSAIRQDTVGDYVARTFGISCIALPSFWLGTMVVVFPSIWWGWSPSIDYIPLFENPLENLAQFIVPATILGMLLSGTTMRMMRTMMLEVLRQDYIRTAWSKGLKERTVVYSHALKNALIPVVTVVGVQLPVMIGGSIVMEQIFSLPGIGRLVVEVITVRDYTVLSGINLFVAFMVLVINLIVDLTYAFLDPRIHYK
jgi:peptide/nickel transport system permease protein